MRTRREPPIQIKTPAQLALMREAGLVVGAHPATPSRPRSSPASAPPSWTRSPSGRSARRARFRPSRAITATRPRSAPRSTTRSCTASPARAGGWREGDLISIDCGAIVDGWHGDAARHRRGRRGQRRAARLLEACERPLWHGLAQARPGAPAERHLARGRDERAGQRAGTASSRSTSATASAPRCTWTRRCPTTAGLAAGRCWPRGWRSPSSRCSVLGRPETRVLDDDWTVVTADGTWAAHFEHTVAITADGPWVLTAEDGGRG